MVNKLVDCSSQWWEFVRTLRNSQREFFGNTKIITKEEHAEFMFKHCNNYYVCLNGIIPVGFIGVVDGDIRLAVCPGYQRRGIGKFMLKGLLEKHKDGFAKIRITNSASIALFISCGFKIDYFVLTK